MVNILGLEFVFYSLSVLAVISGLMVISSKNPVHSVFFLVLVFCLCAGIILLLNVEFLSMIFIVVYVGAIAVLFLFVVMMMDIWLVELDQIFVRYVPIGGVIGIILLYELYFILTNNFLNFSVGLEYNNEIIKEVNLTPTIYALGEIIYSYNVLEFIISGVILLVSMIGTIVITLNHQLNVKRQEVYKQVGWEIKTVVKKTC